MDIPNTPDDDAVVAVNLSKIRMAQEAAASGHASLRSILGHAEAKGINLKAAKRALKIVKDGGADDWLEEAAAITKYLRILRHGISTTQLELFETAETHLEPLEEKAILDGRADGLDGKTEADNPHGVETSAGQAWLKAFRDASEERRLILAMADDEEGEEQDEAA